MKAFSQPGQFFNTLTAQGSRVEHTTSWLTINPYKGCPLKCSYCFRAAWDAPNHAVADYDVDQAIDELISHPLFTAHQTPLSINVSSTDALLPNVEKSTFRAIELLENKRLRNAFGIVSKLGLKPEQIRFLESLRYVRPIVFVSLALLPKHIEPVPVGPRLRNVWLLAQTNIPCVLYFRPIVEGWNDSREKIEQLLLLGNEYCTAVCIGALRLSPEIRESIARSDAQISPSTDSNFHSKELSSVIENRILSIYDELKLTVPLFKHTSCAVSMITKIANYNALYQYPVEHCVVSCPSLQQERCKCG